MKIEYLHASKHGNGALVDEGTPMPPEPPEPPAPVDEPATAAQAPPESATAKSCTVAARIRLVGRIRTGGVYCVRDPRQFRTIEGKVQAGQPNWLKYYVRYATGAQHPVFGMPDRAAAASYDYKGPYPRRLWGAPDRGRAMGTDEEFRGRDARSRCRSGIRVPRSAGPRRLRR